MSEQFNEKAESRSQQRLMGWVHACQKSNKCGSDKIEKIAKSIKYKDAEDFAKTKHEGLPEKVKKKKKKTKKEATEWHLPTFKEWMELKEVGTGTNCVAAFRAPIGATPEEKKPKRRKWPPEIGK